MRYAAVVCIRTQKALTRGRTDHIAARVSYLQFPSHCSISTSHFHSVTFSLEKRCLLSRPDIVTLVLVYV